MCEIEKGVQFNKSRTSETGSYPLINGGVSPSGFIEQYNQEENTITISQGGASAGFVNWLQTKFWAGAHCYVIHPNEKEIDKRYTYHSLKHQESFFVRSQYGAGIPSLSRKTIEDFLIPLPPLEEQRRIAGVLDKFEALTSSLSEGLPAEIAARRRQYAYWRERLLGFGGAGGDGTGH